MAKKLEHNDSQTPPHWPTVPKVPQETTETDASGGSYRRSSSGLSYHLLRIIILDLTS